MANYTVQDRAGEVRELRAVKVGGGSSRHPDRERWFEVDLFVTLAGELAAHTRGCSSVPGERELHDCLVTRSPYELLEFLRVRHAGRVYVPRASVLALSQAAVGGDPWLSLYREAQVVTADAP